MVTGGDYRIPQGSERDRFVDMVWKAWKGRTCPWCGNLVEPLWHSLLSTFVFQCRVCGNLLETFELYADTTGHVYTERHELHDPLGPYPFRPLRRR